MRVRSPIGDLPFRVESFGRDGRELVVHGRLGEWRSDIHVSAADLGEVARAVPRPLLAAAGLALAAVCWRARR